MRRGSRERLRRPWRVRGMRMALGLALWGVCAVLIYFCFLRPQPLPPNAAFQVCVWAEDVPMLKMAADLSAQDRLCLDALHYSNGLFHLTLTREGDVLRVRSFNDSMADPLVYAYRVEGQRVVPLWWMHGGSLRKMVSGFYAIAAAAIVFRMLLWWMRRKRWPMGRWFGV